LAQWAYEAQVQPAKKRAARPSTGVLPGFNGERFVVVTDTGFLGLEEA